MLQNSFALSEKLAPIRAGTGDHGSGARQKTLYLLNYIDDEDYRRRILTS